MKQTRYIGDALAVLAPGGAVQAPPGVARLVRALKHSPNCLYWAAWALGGMYNFSRDMFDAPLYPLFVYNAAFFLTWGVLGKLAVPLIKRFPLSWHWRSMLFHLIVGMIFTEVDVTIGEWAAEHILGMAHGHSFWQIAVIAFKGCFHLGLVTYMIFLAIVQAVHMRTLARQSELKSHEHKIAQIRAELQSLKMQLQPHFLFNTLNAIASFMHYDVVTADRMLNRLSEVLRISLSETAKDEVSLKDEVAFIEAYLEIEKIRFEHRLEIDWSIPPHLQNNAIPSFILQPLVENAIKHGVAPRAEGGRILIRAYESDEALMLEVEDDAPGALKSNKGFGIGISNTRARLEALYGPGTYFELLRAGMGTVARIRLPRTLLQTQRLAA